MIQERGLKSIQQNYVARNAYGTSSVNRKFDFLIKKQYPTLAQSINMPEFQRQSGISRSDQLNYLSKYMAILRYHSMQIVNQKGKILKNKYVGSNEKIEVLNNKTDCMKIAQQQVDKLLFKYGIPELLYENPNVLDRIIQGVQHKD